eukprot:363259-Chlamydomonas_euryale.AAC.3
MQPDIRRRVRSSRGRVLPERLDDLVQQWRAVRSWQAGRPALPRGLRLVPGVVKRTPHGRQCLRHVLQPGLHG